MPQADPATLTPAGREAAANATAKPISAIPAGHLAVKPAKPEWAVRIPERGMRLMRADGEIVPANAYWQRRLRAGDVVAIPADVWAEQEAGKLAAAREAEAKAKQAADAAAKDQAAKDQVAKDQVAKDQVAKDQAAKDQAAK